MSRSAWGQHGSLAVKTWFGLSYAMKRAFGIPAASNCPCSIGCIRSPVQCSTRQGARTSPSSA
jgi:hypothetical protein